MADPLVTPSRDEVCRLVQQHTENLFNDAVRRFGAHAFNDPINRGDERDLTKAQAALTDLLMRSYSRKAGQIDSERAAERSWRV